MLPCSIYLGGQKLELGITSLSCWCYNDVSMTVTMMENKTDVSMKAILMLGVSMFLVGPLHCTAYTPHEKCNVSKLEIQMNSYKIQYK